MHLGDKTFIYQSFS